MIGIYCVVWNITLNACIYSIEPCCLIPNCGSNVFQGHSDDAKESRIKQIPKIQGSRFKIQDSRIKFQESRVKNNQDQDSRLKIQESRKDSIKISTKKVFQKH